MAGHIPQFIRDMVSPDVLAILDSPMLGEGGPVTIVPTFSGPVSKPRVRLRSRFTSDDGTTWWQVTTSCRRATTLWWPTPQLAWEQAADLAPEWADR